MNNLTKYTFKVTKKDRLAKTKQIPKVIWITGLSGSGKSTIGNELEDILFNKLNLNTYTLDGDNIRSGLNKDLGFTDIARQENIRRISETASLFLDAGIIVICTFISPFKEDRDQAKALIGKDNFIEVFIDTSIEECIKRDPKGLYKKAIAGEIPNFTGIDSAYEEPDAPDLTIKTKDKTPLECANEIISKIEGELNC